MFEMDIKTIALIMFGIIIIYLLYKTRKIQSETGKIEGFAVTDDMKKAINEIYNADIDAIRNLSSIATKITSANDTIVLPANMTEMKGDAFIHRSLGVYGDLKVSGNVYFNNKDDLLMNILPRFTVLAFYSSDIPKGWAPCNGKIYKLNDKGIAIETIEGGTYCPDLSGRMIISTGKGGGLTERKRNDVGGFETHTLSVDEIPSHNHYLFVKNSDGGVGTVNTLFPSITSINTYVHGVSNSNNNTTRYALNAGSTTPADAGLSSSKGSGWPHPIMNPYFAMPYIMKL
jgi:microcystin-dependent protein